MERLAEPNVHLNLAGKPTVLDLLLDSPIKQREVGKEQTTGGTFFFRTVPRDGRKQRDESLPPGYYSPNYKVVYRCLPIPSFQKNLKKASVFSRTRPPTPVENSQNRRHAVSAVSSPTTAVKMGFTSFAKMSSRTDLFLISPGANEKRFENFELYDRDRKQALK